MGQIELSSGSGLNSVYAENDVALGVLSHFFTATPPKVGFFLLLQLWAPYLSSLISHLSSLSLAQLEANLLMISTPLHVGNLSSLLLGFFFCSKLNSEDKLSNCVASYDWEIKVFTLGLELLSLVYCLFILDVYSCIDPWVDRVLVSILISMNMGSLQTCI